MRDNMSKRKKTSLKESQINHDTSDQIGKLMGSNSGEGLFSKQGVYDKGIFEENLLKGMRKAELRVAYETSQKTVDSLGTNLDDNQRRAAKDNLY